MECITCLHQSSTRCVCATLVPSSVEHHFCFGALAVVPVVHHPIVLHVHTTYGQWMMLSGTHMASHSPPAIHITSHSTLLLASKWLPMMVSTSKSFGKSPLHTHRSNPSITIIRVPSNTSHHMAQCVSNVDVTLATHRITITFTCFPPPALHQW